jgi:hypothetical protein
MTTTTAPARDVDLTPHPARPRGALISLVLAILAVPGVTMAWDLPAGGLWVGLPLGAAAIVVGIRARGDSSATPGGRRIAAGAIVLAALCLLSMPVFVIASALG